MTGTLYINNVWYRTINVDEWRDRIQYLIPSDSEPRYTKECHFPLDNLIENHMLYFVHVGYGFYHCQVTHDLFRVAFKDRYDDGL
jgi:hypothetical protein